PGQVVAHRRAGHPSHRAETAGDAATGGHGDVLRAAGRHSHGHRGRRAQGHRDRDGRQRGGIVGHVDPQFLARHPADHAGVGQVAPAAGLRLCVAGGRLLDVDEDHVDAGPGAVHGHRGLPDAAYPLGHAGGAQRRLRAHRARQGRGAAPRGPQARAAQRADAYRDPRDAAVRRAAGRRRADRTGIHHPGFRQADRRRGVHPRLRGRARGGAVRRRGLHHHEPAGRHSLHPGQPPPEARMSAHLATATAVPPPRSRNRAWGKFKRNRVALLGAAIVLLFVALALLAPLLATHDPLQTSFMSIRKAPSAAFWLGSDELGRDIYSRMLYGARASLMAGLVSVVIALIVGVPFGLVSGYFGGWIDSVLSRCTEALLAIPFLILAIALAAFLGPSLTNAMIAIGVSAAPKFIRLARGQVLAVKN